MALQHFEYIAPYPLPHHKIAFGAEVGIVRPDDRRVSCFVLRFESAYRDIAEVIDHQQLIERNFFGAVAAHLRNNADDRGLATDGSVNDRFHTFE